MAIIAARKLAFNAAISLQPRYAPRVRAGARLALAHQWDHHQGLELVRSPRKADSELALAAADGESVSLTGHAGELLEVCGETREALDSYSALARAGRECTRQDSAAEPGLCDFRALAMTMAARLRDQNAMVRRRSRALFGAGVT